MSCSLRGNSCSFTGRLSYAGWYTWVGKKDLEDLSFWIASDDWRVSWCFRSLYIADIFWGMIQAILGSLCDACVFLNIYTFNNPERDF